MEEKKEEIGSMCVVLHHERSFHNIDIQTLKSDLQKYSRRAMFSPNGVWCLIELDLFSSLEIQPNLYSNKQLTQKQIRQNSVRIRSNMINHLIVMMSEDVGPSNSQLPNQIYNYYLQWIKYRRQKSSRTILIQLYYSLANEHIQRSRLLSDLRTVYNLPEYLTNDNKNLHQQLLEKFQMNQLIKIMYGDQCRGKKKEDIYELVVEHLEMKSELAFAYLSILFQRNDETLIKQQLWPYLIRISPHPDSTRALAFFYKTLKHKEHYLYLYHAMAFIIYQDKIKKIEQKQKNLIDIDVDKLYKDHLKEETKIELDSFVFDRHTGATTSRSDFAVEGAFVVNECKELFIQKYREMYKEFKIMIDNQEQPKRKIKDSEEESTIKKKPTLNTHEQITDVDLDTEITRLDYHLDIKSSSFISDILLTLGHGQRRTCFHKKAVFISSDYVYKGPYLTSSQGDMRKFLHNLYFTRALITLEQYLKIPNHLCSIMDWDSVIKIDNTNEYYLKQKSIGKLSTSDDDHEIVTTKLETNVKILRRGSHVTRLADLEKDESNFQYIDKNICQTCVQHFYLRFILNIGDSRTGNILIRRDGIKGICGIDFEEIGTQKTKETNDPLTMIMGKLSKRQRDLYELYTNKISIFKSKIDLSDQLAKTLSTMFKIDVEQMNERIEDYANCIAKKK